MKVVYGDIWEYPADYICLTTNGSIRRDGAAVMGRGVALQSRQRVVGIEHLLGACIKEFGLHTYFIDERYLAFPVKHHWYERADLLLIQKSAWELNLITGKLHQKSIFVLPRPGCGNGGLSWDEVRPVLESVGLPDNVHIIDRREDK